MRNSVAILCFVISFAALSLTMYAVQVYAAANNAPCGLGFTNNAVENANWNKIGGVLTGLDLDAGLGLCTPTTTTTTTT